MASTPSTNGMEIRYFNDRTPDAVYEALTAAKERTFRIRNTIATVLLLITMAAAFESHGARISRWWTEKNRIQLQASALQTVKLRQSDQYRNHGMVSGSLELLQIRIPQAPGATLWTARLPETGNAGFWAEYCDLQTCQLIDQDGTVYAGIKVSRQIPSELPELEEDADRAEEVSRSRLKPLATRLSLAPAKSR